MTHVLIFGTSITYGVWDKEGGWVQRLRSFLDNKSLIEGLDKFYSLVYNLGISGDTAEGILARLDNETEPRIDDKEKTMFIFSLGTNDSMFNNTTKSLRFSPETFENNVREIIKRAKNYSTKILFVDAIPVDESKVDPIPWRLEMSYRNKLIHQFNEITKRVCKETDVEYVDIYSEWIKEDYGSYLYDGVHPNSKGHQLIFEKINDRVLQLIS